MLIQRLLTAIVLLLLIAGTLALGHEAFALLAIVLVSIGIYEWLRLAGIKSSVVSTVLAAVAGALLWGLDRGVQSPGLRVVLSELALVDWVFVLALLWVVQRGRAVVLSPALNLMLCVVLMSAAWLALMDLSRAGALTLISALAVVWVADIAAYFSGRAWGKRKLADRISPGKTWAGVGGAMGAVVLLATSAAYVWPELPLFTTQLMQRFAPLYAWGLLVGLVVLAIAGDLFESLLKRQAGVKDSGVVLPGHGGVLDRIDALLPVLPALLLIRHFGGL